MKRRKILSFAMALVMCISMCMPGLTAYAVDPGDIPPVEPVCTCEDKCTEDSIDFECDVCSTDFSQCEVPITANTTPGITPFAENIVTYIDANGANQTLDLDANNVSVFESRTGQSLYLQGSLWYVISGHCGTSIGNNSKINYGINRDEVNILLLDNSTLDLGTFSPHLNRANVTLNIYAQSKGENAGKLMVSNGIIGEDNFTVNIYGGNICTDKIEASNIKISGGTIRNYDPDDFKGVIGTSDKDLVVESIEISGWANVAFQGTIGSTFEMGCTVEEIYIGDSEDVYVNVMAKGLWSPAIGGMDGSFVGEITIDNGTVIAKGADEAPGIGAGTVQGNLGTPTGSLGEISIRGGKVTAEGGSGAPGIGTTVMPFNSITISGGTVTATGGDGAAGIGSGTNTFNGTCKGGNITISDGNVTATGGSKGPGIGVCSGVQLNRIEISGATVKATGGSDAPGIGAASNGKCDEIHITDGDITANGTGNAPAIGTVVESACTDITISGGTVTANGGIDGEVTNVSLINNAKVYLYGERYGINADQVTIEDTIFLWAHTNTSGNNAISYDTKLNLVNRSGKDDTYLAESGKRDADLKPFAAGKNKLKTARASFDGSTLSLSNDGSATYTVDTKMAEDEIKGNWACLYEAIRTSYTVTYVFQSGTSDMELPNGVMDLLPRQDSVLHGDATTDPTLSSTRVDVSDGYWKFEGWTGGTMSATENVKLIGTWKFYSNEITLTLVGITGYTGGDSMNDDSFPAVRYEITAPAGVNVADLTFSVDNQSGKAIQAGSYYVIPALSNTFTLQETEVQGAAADSDVQAGTYDIGVADDDNITASAGETTYNVVIADEGELTVRYVSEPEKVLDEENPVTITTPVVTNESQVNTQTGMAVAVIEDGANFYTNGKSENLGIVGTGTNAASAQISLLFDDILALNVAVGEDEDAVQLLINRANDAQSGVTFTSGQYEFKYMDLVNANDGNAWVSTDKDITIFWPYPEEVQSNYSNYIFQVVHFTGLHREDYADNSNGVVNQINSAGVEVITATATADGVKFTLKGNAENGSFSPFALVWTATTPTPVYDLTYYANGGSGGSHSIPYAVNAVATVSSNNWFSRTDYTFNGWNTKADGTGTPYAVGASITMTGDVNLYAQWRYTGGTVDPTPTEHTLRYETNGGEYIQSETKKVSWTKEYTNLPTPQRDGYTFAGWYRNSTLTMPITGDVKVYGTVTIYAKWNKTVVDPDDTGVSDLLNTQDHKEYLHGYDTGLFGPNNDMTRAEAAQMFYNLLLDKDVPITVNFSDVPADAWYATAVNTLASLGLVEGVGNNEFAPDRAITRAEFTVIAMRFTNGEVSGENIFSDISANDWFYDQVVGSIQYGWITGYEDGTFRPNTTIARAEVTTIVNRMLGRSADVDYVDRHKDDLRLFPDVSQDYWAYYQIVEATNAHDYTKEGNTESWSKLK